MENYDLFLILFSELHGDWSPLNKALRYRHSHDLLVSQPHQRSGTSQACGTRLYRKGRSGRSISGRKLPESPHRLSVGEQQRGSLGEIQAVIEIQNNPLIELLINEKEVLIPLQEDFIVHIDWKKRELTMQLPEGLIELYLE